MNEVFYSNPYRLIQSMRLIQKRKLAEMLDIHHSTLDRWMHEGKFPRGIQLSDQITVFRVVDVAQWLRRKEIRRDRKRKVMSL